MKWSRRLMYLAGVVGIISWAGYGDRMIRSNYPPSLAADAILMAGLVCIAIGLMMRNQK